MVLCLCGDINADFSRNTGFVHFVQQQLDDLTLASAWDRHLVDFTFIYNDANDASHVAVIDHFFWNQLAEQAICDTGVLHLPENTSDHCPIYCTIDFDLVIVDKATKQNKNASVKPCWKKATEEQNWGNDDVIYAVAYKGNEGLDFKKVKAIGQQRE